MPTSLQAAPPELGPKRAVADAEHDVTDVRRFALYVGANNGGNDREILRYAGTDAHSISSVLSELGGVDEQQREMLLEPDTAGLQLAFERVARRIRSQSQAGGARARVEFVFYYSGHSDESGLLMAGKSLAYADLRRMIAGVPADVHIAVLDSCESGAFTRLKGGRHRAPFLVAGAGSVKGHAFLTSSSADEAAQESDRLGASFFTHYLVTGMRGAADVDRDGLVTVNEAYQFARNETLSRTEVTRGGPQHAAYALQLAGTGDLVLTDVRAATAKLEVDAALEGRVFIRDESGRLVAEFYKSPASGRMTLALVPGRYSIVVDDGEKHWSAELVVGETDYAQLAPDALSVVQTEINRERGGAVEPLPAPDAHDSSVPGPPEPEHARVGFGIGVAPTVSTAYRGPNVLVTVAGIDLAVGASTIWRLHGIGLALGMHRVRDRMHGIQAALGFSLIEGDAHGVQVALGMALTKGRMRGMQYALGNSTILGELQGVQAALGATHVSGRLRGVQAALGANTARGPVQGIQLAVGGNYAQDEVQGIQSAIGANIARNNIRGVQVAVGGNFSHRVEGIQAAVGANIAPDEARGMQTAVGANYAGELRGVQIGLVNITRGEVRGAQIGLINYAKKARASIGLLPITRSDGGIGAEVWTSDRAAFNVALRFDARYTYALWTVGLHPGGKGRAWMHGFAFGVQVRPVERLRLALDAHWQSVFEDFKKPKGVRYLSSEQQMLTLRLMASWNFMRRLAIVAGPTLTTQFDLLPDSGIRRPGYAYGGQTIADDDYYEIRLWGGFMLGVRI